MLRKQRFTLITSTFLVVLALSAMMTVPAFADDSAPPPPVDTPTEVVPPADEPAVVDAPPAEEPAPTEAAPAEVVPTDAAPAEATITEVLAQVPEGTEMQVVNADGESVSLATQEAADVFVDGDPIWCPVGVAPKASTGGCSPSFTSFTDDAAPDAGLVAWLNDPAHAAAVSKAGVIWVASSYTGSTETAPIVINGSSVAGTMETFALTIKGGWSGTDLSTVIDPNNPSKFNSGVSLSIINWLGNITLSDIVIDGANSNVAANDAGLTIQTTKNIQLDRVTVQNSHNSNASFKKGGAFLDNSTGAGTVTVIINNSYFDNNEGYGLQVNSAGIVTTNNLYANLNGGAGAIIDNTFATADKAVTLKGQKQFNSNTGDGLTVNSDGLVTLSNIVANYNGGNGAIINNTTSLTKQGVTVSGTNYFMGNVGGDGLSVQTQGTITASNLNASDNLDNGVILDNCFDVGDDSSCDVTVAKAVTLTGVNTFNNNGADGLSVTSFGNISVSNLIANNNTGNGAHINNQWVNNAILPIASIGTWTLNGYGTFNQNLGTGLLGASNSTMLLNTLTANDNVDDGVNLSTSKVVGSATVTIKGINTFNYNGLNGLVVEADGKITVNSIFASFNTGNGAGLITDDLGMGVTLTGANTFMSNGGTGLSVSSQGVITASNITASFNEIGTVLDNQMDPAKLYGVTLSGSNAFNGNNHDGLQVLSYGAILINNLTANDNGQIAPAAGYGAYLDNCNNVSACTAITPAAVTLTGTVNVNGNYQSGLFIESLGAVTLSTVSAENNGEYGTEIYNNHLPAKPQTVTLKGSNTFNNNGNNGTGFDGLLVWSYGAIALNNVTAYYNSGDGVELDNYQGGFDTIFVKTITLTGVNSFVGNLLDGLKFDSSGAVSLNRVNADFNGDASASVYTGSGITGTAHTGSITLVCGHFLSNEGAGYHLFAPNGPVIIKGYYSYNNAPDFYDGSSETRTNICALP